ncbi:MAG: hypothetical protein AB7F82_05890 [Alphaproteobacteria bacterium]
MTMNVILLPDRSQPTMRKKAIEQVGHMVRLDPQVSSKELLEAFSKTVSAS